LSPCLRQARCHVVRTKVPEPRELGVAHPDSLVVSRQQLVTDAASLASSLTDTSTM